MQNKELQMFVSAAFAGLFSLLYDIRQQTIAQLPPLLHDRGNGGIVPWLAFACAVIAYVGGEHAELRPAHVHGGVYRRVHEVGRAVESWHVVAPEGEAAETEVQTTLQRAGHAIP